MSKCLGKFEDIHLKIDICQDEVGNLESGGTAQEYLQGARCLGREPEGSVRAGDSLGVQDKSIHSIIPSHLYSPSSPR